MSRPDRESPSSRASKGGSQARGKARKRASAEGAGVSAEGAGVSAEGAGTGTPQVLLDLLAARGPSGYEMAPAAVWREAASKFADVSTDLIGTPLARVAPKHGFEREARRLLVMGHIDEIGLIVNHIDDDGYLWFGPVGGWDAQILVGQRVSVNTRGGRVLGVVGKKPIHLLREEDRKKVAEVRDLHIDIGARDGDDARERVRVGDVAVIEADPAELPNGRLISRALDNRLGSFVALEAARLVAAAGGGEWELAAVAVAQEEITFGGSRTSAFALEPDAAIVVDVTHATDAPGIEIKEIGKHELGSGPVLSRGSTLHPQLFELLHDTAEREQIPFTVEATARATGTDADAVHASRAGVPTALVSIPIRYMHSPVELVQLDDVHACARLIAAAALRLEGDVAFAR
jgi:putative aminopeptidase FrvX